MLYLYKKSQQKIHDAFRSTVKCLFFDDLGFQFELSKMSKRFASQTEDEIMKKREKSIPFNTLKSNTASANVFRSYLTESGQNTNFELMEEAELADKLKCFYCDARSQKGELYKLTTFENIRHGLNRHLKAPPYNKKFDIITSDVFSEANACYRAMVSEIKAAGKAAIEHYPMISNEDLVKLYHSVHLTPNTPVGLFNRVQMNIRLFFCSHASENIVSMTKTTFVIGKYPDGKRFVYKATDELTKNHRNDTELASGHMPEEPDNDLCPVALYELYLSKLNPKCDRLWQYSRESFVQEDLVWYQNKPVGRDALASFLPKLSREVALSRIYTNHSIRVTGTSILSQMNFNIAQIMSAGHKSVSSLALYQKVGDPEKQALGSVIADTIKYGATETAHMLSLPAAQSPRRTSTPIAILPGPRFPKFTLFGVRPAPTETVTSENQQL